jgi:hypothetical protein
MSKKGALLGVLILVLISVVLFNKQIFQGVFKDFVFRFNNVRKIVYGEAPNSSQDAAYAPLPLRSDDEADLGFLTEAGMIKWTNIERNKNNKDSLLENKRLNQAAAKKAQDMFNGQYFEHISPKGIGPSELNESVGYKYLVVGENLALGGFKDDQALIEAWMNSPGHRENMLNASFQEIGVAAIKGVYEGKLVWIAVQEFGLASSICPLVDDSLKSQIDTNQKKLEGLMRLITATKKQSESVDNAKEDNNQHQATSYIDLVESYNNLVEKNKLLVSEYNQKIDQYNSCIKKHLK